MLSCSRGIENGQFQIEILEIYIINQKSLAVLDELVQQHSELNKLNQVV